MKQRILAVISAVALITIAVLMRQMLSDDDDSGATAPTVACAPDLMDVCEALANGGVIAAEPPELTLAEAAEPPSDLDGWITWDPAPAIANLDADAVVWDKAKPLAGAPLAILTTGPGTNALANVCVDAPDWTCVLDLDQSEASLGLGPVDTAQGLARLSELAVAASTDLDPSTLNRTRLQELLDSPTNGTDEAQASVDALVVQGPGAFGAVVVPEGSATNATGTGRRNGLDVVRPTSTRTVNVVIAGRDGAEVSGVAAVCGTTDVAEALAGAGVVACKGTADNGELAGFLWQVRERMG